MKRVKPVRFFVAVILPALLSMACQHAGLPTGPGGPAVVPQRDIRWPSLADSPWPMFMHDPQHTGRSPYKGPRRGKVVWSFRAGDEIFSSPVLGQDGTVYFGATDGYLYAVGPDGQLRWKVATPGRRQIYSSPLVSADGNIYVGTGGGLDRGHLVAYDAGGNLVWDRLLEFGGALSPTISRSGDLLFAIASGSQGGGLYAVRRATGQVEWTFVPSAGGLVGSPALSPDGATLYVSAESPPGLWAVSTEGELRWSLTPTVQSSRASTPSVDSDGNVYVNLGDRCFSVAASGAIRWTFPVVEIRSVNSIPVITAKGWIYINGTYNGDRRLPPGNLGDSYVYAVDAAGNLVWGFNLSRLGPSGSKYSVNAPIADRDGSVFLGTVAQPSTSEDTLNLVALNPNGYLRYAVSLRGTGSPPPDIDTNVAIGALGTLYVGSGEPGGRTLFQVR